MALEAVVYREFQEAARLKRTFAARCAYAGLLALPILTTLVASPTNMFPQNLGSTLFNIFIFWQFTLVVLLVPAYAGGSIARERENGTLGLLLLTDLRPLGIILGKLAVECATMAILLLCGLPVLFVVTMFGGVSAGQIFGTFCVTLCTIVLLAAIGLAVSSYSSKGYTAVLTTYLVLLIYGVLLPMFLALLGMKYPLLKAASEILLLFNPGCVLFVAAQDQMGWQSSLQFVLSVVGIVAACVFIGKYGIAREVSPGEKKAGTLKAARKPRGIRLRGEVRGHPLVWREARGTWKPQFAILAVLALGLIAGIYFFSLYPDLSRDLGSILSGIFWFFFYLSVIVRSSTILCTEKEQGTLPLLLASPLSDRQIIGGKYLIIVQEYWVFALGLILFDFLGLLFGGSEFMALGLPARNLSPAMGSLLIVLVPAVKLFFLATVSLAWSLVADNSTKALVYNLVSLVGIQMVLGFLLMLFAITFWRNDIEEYSWLATLCPALLQLWVAFCLFVWMMRNLRRYAART